MGFHVVLGPEPDRPDQKIESLQASEDLIHLGKALVAPERVVGGKAISRFARQDDIEAAQDFLPSDRLVFPSEGKRSFPDGEAVVLSHLKVVKDAACPLADLSLIKRGAGPPVPLRGRCGRVPYSVAAKSSSRFLLRSSARSGLKQATLFGREERGCHLRKVRHVKERHLDHTLFHEVPDGSGARGRYPAETGISFSVP
jgi:hypothetical protein